MKTRGSGGIAPAILTSALDGSLWEGWYYIMWHGMVFYTSIYYIHILQKTRTGYNPTKSAAIFTVSRFLKHGFMYFMVKNNGQDYTTFVFLFFVATFFSVTIHTFWYLGLIYKVAEKNILADYWIIKCLHMLMWNKHVITDAGRTSLDTKLGISANDSSSLRTLPNLFNIRETKTVHKRKYTS